MELKKICPNLQELSIEQAGEINGGLIDWYAFYNFLGGVIRDAGKTFADMCDKGYCPGGISPN